jgi:hypothetical protein
MLPRNFIRVNTIFEAGRANGLVTEYADKYPSHKFLSGTLGVGLSQGYFPEVASVDCTVEAQEAWDGLHCPYSLRLDHRMAYINLSMGSALRNWTLGNRVNGTRNPAGAPSLYSANFQATPCTADTS